MGCTVEELGARMSFAEFRMWLARDARDPISRRRADYNAAAIAQQIARVAALLTGGRSPAIDEVLLHFDPDEIKARRRRRKAAELESLVMTRKIQREAQSQRKQ